LSVLLETKRRKLTGWKAPRYCVMFPG
jgi:hypothetical protein